MFQLRTTSTPKPRGFYIHGVSKMFGRLTRHDSPLLDDFVRPRQHVRRDRQADLLGGLEIYDQLEFCRLLHRQFRGLRAF